MKPKIKICGLRDRENIEEVLALQPDYIGFIFHPTSQRFVGSALDATWVATLKEVNTTGVFVNAAPDQVTATIDRYGFRAVQLHGNETPAYCAALRKTGVAVIKAFGIDERFDWQRVTEYEDAADFFLFDTQSKQHGGTGIRFNWKLLDGYTGNKPFFLSGGIGPENIREAFTMNDTRLYALDLNSKFETAPGLKNSQLLKQTLQTLNDEHISS